MKTLHTTTARNVTASQGRVRAVLTVAGIVIAVLCSIALLQDVHSAERLDARAPSLLETSKIVASDLVGEVKTWL